MLTRLSILAVLVLGACARDYQPQPVEQKMTPAAGASERREPSVRQLSTEVLSTYRCDQQLRCGKIDYGMREACIAGLDANGYSELEGWQCPFIDQKALSVCLASIKVESCSSNLMSSLSPVKECRPEVLCTTVGP